MDAQTIYQIILDQREDIAEYMDDTLIVRSEAAQIDFDSKLAQVVIGVRRSGKSTLCHMALLAQKITYGYVNFDDDRLANITVDDLNAVLEAIYRVYGVEVRHLLLDEVQNVDGWHLFVNRLLRQGVRIFVTGSNAKLLSSELSTHLTGRYHEIRLYPFSFRDYCLANHIPLDLPTTKNISLQQNALHQYLIEGGFPEIRGIKDRHGYVEGVVHAIIHKDIKTRFKLRNANGLYTLAQHLMNNVGQLVNVKELSEKLGVGSNKTVRNYIDYLSQAFLIVPLHKYSFKSSERLVNEKIYLIDTGILTYRHLAAMSDNLGWRLENVVMMELLRRCDLNYQELYYYRPGSKSREVDFVITEHGVVQELIQVSLDISAPKTLQRELKALAEASTKLNCTNLTLVALSKTRNEEIDGRTVHVVDAIEWLLNFGEIHPTVDFNNYTPRKC
jgi:hypothetical protein